MYLFKYRLEKKRRLISYEPPYGKYLVPNLALSNIRHQFSLDVRALALQQHRAPDASSSADETVTAFLPTQYRHTGQAM